MYRRAINRNYITMKPPTHPNRRTVLQLMGAGLASSAALSGAATAHRGGLKGELAEVSSATADYNDPANAYDDGYFAPDRNFEPIPLEDVVEKAHAVCGMGYHFVNPNLMGTEDRTEPQVLVYGEDDDENLILGAVEYLLPQAEKEENREEPDLFAHDDGDEVWQTFHGDWSLHVWVHTKNPDGVFNPTNPRKQFCPE